LPLCYKRGRKANRGAEVTYSKVEHVLKQDRRNKLQIQVHIYISLAITISYYRHKYTYSREASRIA